MTTEQTTFDSLMPAEPVDLTTLPDSAVPSAFDRGHLYSPTLDVTAYATDPRYNGTYDYRPGNDFEPMPEAPRGDGKAYMWWSRNVAKIPVADFLGLQVGDTIAMHHHQGPIEGCTVTATYRSCAHVRYPNPPGAKEPYAVCFVSTRNPAGRWY
jgi:hypothetical protein